MLFKGVLRLILKHIKKTRKGIHVITRNSIANVSHNIRHSKVIYPLKRKTHKTLSKEQTKIFQDCIQDISDECSKLSRSSVIFWDDIQNYLLLHKNINPKYISDIRKYISKMPNVNFSNDNQYITGDDHIKNIQFISDYKYPMITWNNNIKFDRKSMGIVRDIVKFNQLHTLYPGLSGNAKMIICRGIHYEMNTAFRKLTKFSNPFMYRNIDFEKYWKQNLNMNDYVRLVGNLGIDPYQFIDENDLHMDTLRKDVKCMSNYNMNQKYGISPELAMFLRMFETNDNIFHKENMKHLNNIHHLDIIPWIFEMKVLVKIGKLIQYINTYRKNIIYPTFKHNFDFDFIQNDPNLFGNYFDIQHKSKHNTNDKNSNKKSLTLLRQQFNYIKNKEYKVYSEKQLMKGECNFSEEYCTPDVLLNEPIWINKHPVYWFDAKCTKSINCINDQKRRYQMYRFTKQYGYGAIISIGASDLNLYGINDVIILDGSSWL